MRVEVVQRDEVRRRELVVATHPAERVSHERMRGDKDVGTVLSRLGGERARREEPDAPTECSRRSGQCAQLVAAAVSGGIVRDLAPIRGGPAPVQVAERRLHPVDDNDLRRRLDDAELLD